ncbi:MAG: NAD(P)-dependent alcohol dehydrogenase [Anaerolineae bacterium]|nr:NAD(P)-dependent alcohol dehydrogenase [Anaerolineae bacterium]
MPETMSCAVLHGVRDLRIEQRPVPQPQPHEVLVHVKRVGVCGSDIHYYTHGRIGDYVVRAPMILGHESAGVVEAVGSAVTDFAPGDRVAMEPGYTCGKCFYCKTGHYNLCPDVVFMATPPIDGSFCEYIAWPEDFTFHLPDSLSYEDGAMMEPLSVGLWATERGGVKPGDAVAIFGTGTIGLCTLQAALAAGATTAIGVDIEDFRLSHAQRLGATQVINDRSGRALAEIRRLASMLRGFPPEQSGVDVAFETAGSIITTRNALAATRRGGVAVLVGLPPDPMVEIDLVAAASKEIDIRGQFRYANRYPIAIALTAQGKVDVTSMVTHHFDLVQAEEALRFADEHKAEALKVMVDIPD